MNIPVKVCAAVAVLAMGITCSSNVLADSGQASGSVSVAPKNTVSPGMDHSEDRLQDILNKKQSLVQAGVHESADPPAASDSLHAGASRQKQSSSGIVPKNRAAALAATDKPAPEVQKEDIVKMLQRGGSDTLVPPETITPVDMSSSDINRIVCASDIKDVVFSKEKNLTVKTDGKNAFVKYYITRKDGKEIYAVTPTEMYILCNDTTYNLIILPKRVPAQTVRLSSIGDKVKKNTSLYTGKDHEKKIQDILRSIYTEEIPDSFSVSKETKEFDFNPSLRIRQVRTVVVEGEGITVKELSVETMPNVKNFPVTEKMFLRKEISKKVLAIMVDKMNVVSGEISRVFVVEKTGGGSDVK